MMRRRWPSMSRKVHPTPAVAVAMLGSRWKERWTVPQLAASGNFCISSRTAICPGTGKRIPATERPPGSYRGFSGRCGLEKRLRGADETELLQGGDPIVQADFLKDFSVLEFQDGRAGECHLATGIGRQRAHQEVAECGSGMGAAAFPAADDVIAFRDKIRCAPEAQIRESLSEIGHERLDVFPSPARCVERILQQHVGRSDFIDNSEVASLAPEIREPPADNSLVIFFLRHDHFSCYVHSNFRPRSADVLRVDLDMDCHTPVVVVKSKLAKLVLSSDHSALGRCSFRLDQCAFAAHAPATAADQAIRRAQSSS